MVNENVPTTAGVPLSTPAALKASPVGNGPEPAASDHFSGAIPPLAASVCEYATPYLAPGRLAVVMTSGAAMRMLRVCVFVCCGVPVSCTCTTKLAPLVTAVGVPLITPEVLSERPAGSVPELRLQL